MRAHEVERAEVEAHDAGQGGDSPDVVNGLGRFNENAQRNRSSNPSARRVLRECVECALDIADALGFRQCQERDAIACFADENLEIALPRRMADVVNACADASVRIRFRLNQRCDHPRVRDLAADWCAVFAVAGNVEHRAALALQIERLGNEALAAGVMNARRQFRQRAFFAVQSRLR